MQLRKRVLKIRDINGLIRWTDTLVNRSEVIFSTSSSYNHTHKHSLSVTIVRQLRSGCHIINTTQPIA